jgi:formate dehydrogenase assembly factor FdhD
LTHKVKIDEQAADAIIEKSKSNKNRKKVIRKYLCECCGFYHVTSMTKKEHKEKQREQGYGSQVDPDLISNRLNELTKKRK